MAFGSVHSMTKWQLLTYRFCGLVSQLQSASSSPHYSNLACILQLISRMGLFQKKVLLTIGKLTLFTFMRLLDHNRSRPAAYSGLNAAKGISINFVSIHSLCGSAITPYLHRYNTECMDADQPPHTLRLSRLSACSGAAVSHCHRLTQAYSDTHDLPHWGRTALFDLHIPTYAVWTRARASKSRFWRAFDSWGSRTLVVMLH